MSRSLIRVMALDADRSIDAGSMEIWRTRGMSSSEGFCFSVKHKQHTVSQSKKQQPRAEPWRVLCAPLRITLTKEIGLPTVGLSSNIQPLRCREGR